MFPIPEGFDKGVVVSLKYEPSINKRIDRVEYDENLDEWRAILSDGSYCHTDYLELVKPDYKGFGEHLIEAEENGLPIDRAYLMELADKYNTPYL